jgi:hypothetical protein
LTLHLGLDLSLASSVTVTGGGFDPDAEAIFAAFTTPPDDTRKGLINDFVLALKAGDVWDALDCLYVFAAADSQAARVNWRAPGTFIPALIGAPVFTPDRGFTGDGVTAALNTGFAPATAGGLYALNSAHVSARSLSNIAAGATNRLFAQSANDGVSRVLAVVRDGSGNLNSFINSLGTGADPVALPTTLGHFITSRTAAAVTQRYHNGASLGVSDDVSTALPTPNITFLADGHSVVASVLQVASGSIGGALDAAQAAALVAADLAYMQAVGAVP